MARHHEHALCRDRERDFFPEDVGRHAGDWTALYFPGPLERSGGRGGGRQVPPHGRVARACGVSAVVAKRPVVRDFRCKVFPGAERDGSSSRTHPERPRTERDYHGANLAADDGECALPGPGGGRRARREGPAGGDGGGDRNLRHGGLQREPPNERVGHPRGLGRADEARDESWATQREYLTTETPSIGNAVQSRETMRNSLGLNYKNLQEIRIQQRHVPTNCRTRALNRQRRDQPCVNRLPVRSKYARERRVLSRFGSLRRFYSKRDQVR